MGTRSAIGMVLPDKTIRSIYCHWDGYPSHQAPILVDHYKTPEKIEALLNLGSLSILGNEIGHKIDFDSRSDGGQCLAYGRDRGETGTEAQIFKTKKDFKSNYDWCEYFYLYDNGKWTWSSASSHRFTELKSTTK